MRSYLHFAFVRKRQIAFIEYARSQKKWFFKTTDRYFRIVCSMQVVLLSFR